MPSILPLPVSTTPNVVIGGFGALDVGASERILESAKQNVVNQNLTQVLGNEFDLITKQISDKYETIDPETATREYGLNGQLNYTSPVNRGYARERMERKQAENAYNMYMQNASGRSIGEISADFATGVVTSAVDPIEMLLNFTPIPYGGRVSKFLARADLTASERIAARLGKSAAEGFTGGVVAEPVRLAAKTHEGSDYTIADSLYNIALTTAFGLGFGAVATPFHEASIKMDKKTQAGMLDAFLRASDTREAGDLSLKVFELSSPISEFEVKILKGDRRFDAVKDIDSFNKFLDEKYSRGELGGDLKDLVAYRNSAIESGTTPTAIEIVNKQLEPVIEDIKNKRPWEMSKQEYGTYSGSKLEIGAKVQYEGEVGVFLKDPDSNNRYVLKRDDGSIVDISNIDKVEVLSPSGSKKLDHYTIVRQALERGEKVPYEAVKDYPALERDLRLKYGNQVRDAFEKSINDLKIKKLEEAKAIADEKNKSNIPVEKTVPIKQIDGIDISNDIPQKLSKDESVKKLEADIAESVKKASESLDENGKLKLDEIKSDLESGKKDIMKTLRTLGACIAKNLSGEVVE